MEFIVQHTRDDRASVEVPLDPRPLLELTFRGRSQLSDRGRRRCYHKSDQMAGTELADEIRGTSSRQLNHQTPLLSPP